MTTKKQNGSLGSYVKRYALVWGSTAIYRKLSFLSIFQAGIARFKSAHISTKPLI
jgi:hypothetical protein